MSGNSTLCRPTDDPFGLKNPRDTAIQIGLSVALGIIACFSFCILRPRWSGLYAARKKQTEQATALPELPDSLFGWILPLWRISEEQVLAAAGLDAYVFLAFFKMAIKFLLVTLFFALAVIKPVHDRFPDHRVLKPNVTAYDDLNIPDMGSYAQHIRLDLRADLVDTILSRQEYTTDYLWMYLIFAYLFTGLAMFLIVAETRKIIEVRQEYLGSQATITDRTIRLSGIPPELRSEQKIKDFVEGLEIGKVETVTLCRNWKELDDRMVARMTVLRKLEEAWTVYLGHRSVERNLESLPLSQPSPPGPSVIGNGNNEHSLLLEDENPWRTAISPYSRQRPKTKIWYGRFKLRYKTVDALDYYEEKLRRLDEDIVALRKKEFEPTPLAFVTMDSVASAQMAIQAVLDPSPLQLLANTSPAPSDVVWQNTYSSRTRRMVRAWSITLLICILTVFWTALLVPVAGALNTCSIHRVWPQLAHILESHANIRSLVNTQLPTLLISLLNVAVPYFYDWLANLQGMISQGDVELSVISKNFFFTFFNFFVIFTALGTTSNFLGYVGEKLSDTTSIARGLAESLQGLLLFYVNFIILQGLGLFPLRLLEFGTVIQYPIGLMGAKTPRDYAELVQPPIFSYGFYLPQTLLIFIICMVYSVLRSSWMVLLAGLAYFMIGHFVHKYQLLYAMDHRQHSTGRGWVMICDRVIVGMILFQITTAGQLVLKTAWKRAAALIPLIMLTLWFTYIFSRTYRPLMKFIALKSLRRAEHSDLGTAPQEEAQSIDPTGERPVSASRTQETVDEAREKGLRFINPSLIMPLEDVWIADKRVRGEENYGSR